MPGWSLAIPRVWHKKGGHRVPPLRFTRTVSHIIRGHDASLTLEH
jgi:hypothetical protein